MTSEVALRTFSLMRRHWFVLLLPLLASASYGFTTSIDWQLDGRVAEMVASVGGDRHSGRDRAAGDHGRDQNGILRQGQCR